MLKMDGLYACRELDTALEQRSAKEGAGLALLRKQLHTEQSTHSQCQACPRSWH